MLSTKEELKQINGFGWLDDVNVLRNIILLFFMYFFNVNMFYGKLGVNNMVHLFTIK